MYDILDKIDFIIREKSGENDYQIFFKKKLKEWKVKSPSELSDKKKKEFFEMIKKEWKSEKKGE